MDIMLCNKRLGIFFMTVSMFIGSRLITTDFLPYLSPEVKVMSANSTYENVIVQWQESAAWAKIYLCSRSMCIYIQMT